MVIYKITSPSGRIYIGQTVNFKKRIASYKRLDCKKQKKLYASLTKYGWELHELKIIEECASIEEMNNKEIFWIAYYNSCELGLNCNVGGQNKRHRPEVVEKLRIAGKGRKISEETREKLREALRKRVIKDSTRVKLSAWQIGKKLSEETKEKIRAKMVGRPRTEAEIEGRKRAAKKNTGSKMSEEAKRKISLAHKGRPLSEKQKEGHRASSLKRGKSVLIEGVEYTSIAEAARILECSETKIRYRVFSKKEKFKDYYFK